MKLKQRNRKRVACLLAIVLCISPAFSSGNVATAQTEGANSAQDSTVLKNPVIAAEDGKVAWDCIWFGNYWQQEYIPQTGEPEQGEDDAVHTDDDGTKYIVRADKSCYKYEPIKWRVLSVSEDGTDAFLMADQCLEARPYHTENSEAVTWETCALREWLNGTFMQKAFTEDEQEAIMKTEIDNPSYDGGAEVSTEGGATTEDNIYLPSLNDMLDRKYGFTNNFDDSSGCDYSNTETRVVNSSDFAESCEDGWMSRSYLIRTLGVTEENEEYVLFVNEYGGISLTFDEDVNVTHGIRPVLHLDLSKTDVWSYAGQVKQDKTEIAPDSTPAVPTPTPTPQPNVTMAPGQVYPKNPVVYKDDLKKNTWDCIYFGKYYNTKFTPSVLSEAGQHDTMQADENGEYLVRHEEGYFRYEPLKWRVLSINEDGTDAFVMADQVIDVAQYYHRDDVEITWEKSDIRKWLAGDFMTAAFTGREQEKILTSQISTPDNKWSGESGGNDTTDKIYLLSIEEAMDPSYGFGSDEKEGDTRRISVTDYAKAEEQLDWVGSDSGVYWLRSAGSEKGRPATVGYWGAGEIPTEPSNTSTGKLGVRPVMHVDLSDTTLWTYAGQVTPEGVVVPSASSEPTKKPDSTIRPSTSTEKPQSKVESKVKKPGKPAIKKLKNKKGKKVTVTLSKKVSGATGYQVAYATKSSMKGQKKKSFKGTSVTVKKLKKKKTYYFRVRAYTKKNGKTVYGNWGNKKKIKVKK